MIYIHISVFCFRLFYLALSDRSMCPIASMLPLCWFWLCLFVTHDMQQWAESILWTKSCIISFFAHCAAFSSFFLFFFVWSFVLADSKLLFHSNFWHARLQHGFPLSNTMNNGSPPVSLSLSHGAPSHGLHGQYFVIFMKCMRRSQPRRVTTDTVVLLHTCSLHIS